MPGSLIRQIQKFSQICLIGLICLIPYFGLHGRVSAGDYQQCITSTTCTIGEFLYNDDYTVLPGQSCTLTAKYPDGNAFLTSQAMVDRGDGWYSYDATIGTTEGVYSATICCTPSSGLMCLDKTFEVKSPTVAGSTLTAEDVWTYSNRTMTSYGTLVNDVWNASTRSLTSFGSLVGDVWGYSGRTLTSFGSLIEGIWGATPASLTPGASPTNLTGIIAEQKAQRELLEKLVNAPIISLSLDDGSDIPDLESKLNESKKQANLIYDDISVAKSRLFGLDTKWDRLPPDSLTSEISGIAALFQNQESLNYLTKAWDTETVTSLSTGVAELKTDLASLLTSASLNKTPYSPPLLTTIIVALGELETVLGDATSSSQDHTFFGYLASVESRHSNLQSENQKVAALLENINGQGVANSQREIDKVKSRLLTLNQYPGGESLADPAKVSDDKKLNLKNILFSLQALIGLNTQLLAVNVGDPVRSLWLEEGSIIFRAVITNPSSVISQSVPLKFYLPREVKTEDIITLDPSLSTTYDSTEEALYASGQYNLKPKETKVVYIEIEDIWQLTASEIETLRHQATSLLKPLEKTAYFSQGTTLKSDIDVTLDKVMLATTKAVTPENRIRAYREGKLELTKVTANMNRLEDLVAQASGTGSLFGFVGGVQTMAVWGIILVVVAGFVFLSVYFKKLGLAPGPAKSEIKTAPLASSLESKSAPAWQMPAIIAVVVVITAGGTIFLTQLAKPKPAPVINQVILASPSPTPSPTPNPSATEDVVIDSEKSILGSSSDPATVTLTVPPDSSINVRNRPSADADIVMSIKDSRQILVFDQDGDWRQIGFTPSDSTKGYWVHAKFVSEK